MKYRYNIYPQSKGKHRLICGKPLDWDYDLVKPDNCEQ